MANSMLLNIAQSFLLAADGIYGRQKRIVVLTLNVDVIAVIRFLATL